MICGRCQTPIDDGQPLAAMTYQGREMGELHVSCARLLQSWLRDFIISNNRLNDILIAERDSLVIHAPGKEVSA